MCSLNFFHSSHRECLHDDKLGMLAFLLAEEVEGVTESPHRWHSQALWNRFCLSSNELLGKQERLCIYDDKMSYWYNTLQVLDKL